MPWSVAATTSTKNAGFHHGYVTGRKGEPAFDAWSIIHTAVGCGFGFFRWSWWVVLAILVGYEVFEALLRQFRRRGGKGLFEHESWANIATDLVVAMVGWAAVKAILLATST